MLSPKALKSLLLKLKPEKSVGVDDIHPHITILFAPYIAPTLEALFNHSLAVGKLCYD